MVKCNFCGEEIVRGTGKIYVKKDGKVLNLCSNKCEKNMFKLGRIAREIPWTAEYKIFKKMNKLLSPGAHPGSGWQHWSLRHTDALRSTFLPSTYLSGQITHVGTDTGCVTGLFAAVKQDLHSIRFSTQNIRWEIDLG